MNYDKDYKKKLERFNSTTKYKYEMCFIEDLVAPKKNENILDYGCGLGTIVEDLILKFPETNIVGHDKYQYIEDQEWFRPSFHFKMDKVYFMHSLAHIENLFDNLKYLIENLNPDGKIYVLTPNRNWIENIRGLSENSHYVPDPTLVRDHFAPIELEMLFNDLDLRIETIGQIGKEFSGTHERLFLKASK